MRATDGIGIQRDCPWTTKVRYHFGRHPSHPTQTHQRVFHMFTMCARHMHSRTHNLFNVQAVGRHSGHRNRCSMKVAHRGNRLCGIPTPCCRRDRGELGNLHRQLDTSCDVHVNLVYMDRDIRPRCGIQQYAHIVCKRCQRSCPGTSNATSIAHAVLHCLVYLRQYGATVGSQRGFQKANMDETESWLPAEAGT